MKISLKNIGDFLFKGYLFLVFIWLGFALSFQSFGIYLHFTNQDERARDISNKISWKIDGTFKDLPENIWYEEPKK